MGKRCLICGRRIKSGWKYCWKHRHFGPTPKKRGRKIDSASMLLIIGIILILIWIFSFTLPLNFSDRIVTTLLFLSAGVVFIWLSVKIIKNKIKIKTKREEFTNVER